MKNRNSIAKQIAREALAASGKVVERKCKNCKQPFMAREADVKRGWAKFCSKSCKAKEQTRRTGYAGPSDSYLSYGSGDYEDKADGGLRYAPSHGQDYEA